MTDQQQSVIDSVVDNTYEVEVDGEVADALVECVTDLTGWCVVSLTYRNVASIH